MKSFVSIQNCSSYTQTEIDKTIEKCLNDFGGIKHFVTHGKKVLLKPNILIGKSPEECATTHPSIIRALIKQIKNAGGIPIVGDSPGAAIHGTSKVLENTGIKKAVVEEGGEIANFETCGITKIKTNFAFLPYYYTSNIIYNVDLIINLPKLKTHQLVKYTGAIKNMFGIIPGMHKPEIHRHCPGINEFSQALVNIFSNIKPALNIMDAVYGMEGDGPSGGNPKKIGYIIASADAVALDSVCSYLIGYNVTDILTTNIAYEQNLGEMNFKNIDTGGINLASIRISDYAKPHVNITQIIPKPILKFIYKYIKTKPYVNYSKCKQCFICIKHCPVSAIKFHYNKFIFNYDLCIECYCCCELCTYNAVEIKPNFITRFILGER
ncbi:DUF362 domain-containing protein [Candidatus Poribacteria bacterium]|nr:DUF362 domain-containing protein [Candidatus Poribacteria bacterium]